MFDLESLEPRLMLSGAAGVLPVLIAESSGGATAVDELRAGATESNQQAVTGRDTTPGLFDGMGETPASLETAREESSLDDRSHSSDPLYLSDQPTPTPTPADPQLPPLVTQLVTTLVVGQGPPARNTATLPDATSLIDLPGVPGLAADASTLEAMRGQLVFLNFSGAEGLSYRGPVTINGISIRDYTTPEGVTTDRAAVIAEVTQRLNALFAGLGVTIVAEQPDEEAVVAQ